MTSTKKVNPDLEKERAKCNFDGAEFTTWWYGGADKLKLKRKIGKLSSTPTFKGNLKVISQYLILRC